MHVAIIPDGNRRWARERGLVATLGHHAAGEEKRLRPLLERAIELEITHLSLWVFSTDNWKRPEKEKEKLFSLLTKRIDSLIILAEELGVRVLAIGRRDRIPDAVKEAIERVEKKTENNQGLRFQICFDYGGRDEILRAVNQAVKDGEPLTEETFSQLLDTNGIPDPDLIIRTSGEQRLSGFFPWQGIYAELYFTDKHFPDFGPDDLTKAVDEFRSRQRRFGGD